MKIVTEHAGKTKEQLQEIFSNDADLQAEFSSFENFSAYQNAAEQGKISIIEKAVAQTEFKAGLNTATLETLYRCSKPLQAEFQKAENFVAFYQAIEKNLIGPTNKWCLSSIFTF